MLVGRDIVVRCFGGMLLMIFVVCVMRLKMYDIFGKLSFLE